MNTKEEILKEFKTRWKDDTTVGGYYGELHTFLSKALDRYALAVVEESLPEKLSQEALERDGDKTNQWLESFNSCRSQVLENALRIVGRGENREKK